MYPWWRLTKLFVANKFRKPLDVKETSVIKSRVCLTDIDPFLEMNNGRYLTLFDFGRYDVAWRTGLWKAMKKNGLGFMVAGISIRYRYRLRLFIPFEIHSKVVAMDERWIYFEQRFISRGKLHTAALVRTAVTSPKGLVPTKEILKLMGLEDLEMPVPDWIKHWAESDQMRPWE
jgi:acyl-CoA thioesterase FadM